MRTLSVSDLPAFFQTIKGATFATIVTETDARVRAACPLGRNVRKVTRLNVCLNHSYEAAVNRQRVREGNEATFEAAPRQWGKRIPGTTLVEHNGKFYLETKVEKSLAREFRVDGKIVPDDQVVPYLQSKGGSRQDLEKEVIVRDFALDSIRHIVCKGEEFVVV